MDFKSKNIFDFVRYKSFLSAVVKQNKNRRGMYKEMANSANCQPSYLSQVMRKDSKIQLTPDQALGISKYLFLSPKERDYFLILVDLERAASKELQKLLHDKAEVIRRSALDIGNILDRPKLDNHNALVKFYSNWLYSYIHVLTSIPEFQNTESIANKISLPVETTMILLSELEEMGLVLREHGQWKHSGQQLHIEAKSPLALHNHNNWRQQSLLNAQLNNSLETVHFSGVYSISKSDYSKIKSHVLDCLKNVNSSALASGAEEVIVFCCDLFER